MMTPNGALGTKRSYLFASLLFAIVFAVAGCDTVQLEAGFRQPIELTATAVAQSTEPNPTPKPQLGKIAFVRGGDIWTKDLPDGEAIRLTKDGRSSEPRWSVSGEWLAFRKDYQVWIVRADGSAAHPVQAGSTVSQFAWSPSEDVLAYTTGVGSLRTTRPESPDQKELAPQENGVQGTGVNAIAWSPDGMWIAFEKQDRQPQQPPSAQGILRIRADGTELQEVYLNANPSLNQSQLAGWSPDGQLILFWKGEQMSPSLLADGVPLLSVSIMGGGPIEVTARALDRRDLFAWSPDGRQLALTDGGRRETWDNKAIAIATVAGGDLRRLSENGQADLFPAWSPDGRWVAFASGPAAPGVGGGDGAKQALAQRRIWLMQPDGSAKRQLTNDSGFRDEHPQWSVDGSAILFARLQEDQAQVWLMRSDGTGQRQIVDELTPSPGWFGYYGYLDWGSLYDWWLGRSVSR